MKIEIKDIGDLDGILRGNIALPGVALEGTRYVELSMPGDSEIALRFEDGRYHTEWISCHCNQNRDYPDAEFDTFDEVIACIINILFSRVQVFPPGEFGS